MGCGGSKLDPNNQAIPARLRPLLWLRFEEIKRHRNGHNLKDSTSKKELIKNSISDDDNSSRSHSPSDNDRESMSSQEDSLKVAPAPKSNETIAKVIKDNAVETTLASVLPKVALATNTEFDNSGKNVEEDNVVEAQILLEFPKEEEELGPAETKKVLEIVDSKYEDKEGQEKVVETVDNAMGEMEVMETDRRNEEQDLIEDEEEGRLSNMNEAFICPGSPSFRVYYIESLANIKDDGKDKNDDTDKKSLSEDIGVNVESVDSHSNEVSATKEKKKARKGGRLRRVIPKAKPGAVKNLLNVKSCYNPACAGHDNTRLLEPKAVA